MLIWVIASSERPREENVSWTIALVDEGEVSISSFVSRTVVSYDSASLFAPTYPPNPMESAPAVNSARPPRTTTLVFPRAERPALSAKGTVKPSERPRMESDTIRGLIRARELLVLLASSSRVESSNVSYPGRCDSTSS